MNVNKMNKNQGAYLVKITRKEQKFSKCLGTPYGYYNFSFLVFTHKLLKFVNPRKNIVNYSVSLNDKLSTTY